MNESSHQHAVEVLSTQVQFLKGVGPQRAELLARLGLHTVRDVLFYFPRDYHDLSDLRAISELEEDQLQSIRGQVAEIELRNTASGGSILGVLVTQGNESIRAVWFNQTYMQNRLQRGATVLLFGKPKFRGMRWEISHPRVVVLDEEEDFEPGEWQPVYPATQGLSQFQLRVIVRHALEDYLDVLEEVFPPALLDRYDLLPLRDALPQIHFPRNAQNLEQARRRFVFQELFVLQLALSLRRHQLHDLRQAPKLENSAKIDARIRRLFPFEFTPDQEQAIKEVTADMAEDRPMNRLLQGDVGSGKTVVALYAILLAVAHQHQAVLMAPTEVLARQHAEVLAAALAKSHVRCTLLTGGLGVRQRRVAIEEIAGGEVDVVIGTQAIVQSGVEFAQLGLVVIDEQHKFGVRQRAILKEAGVDPHYLVMTATPIPRTIGMTIFGDLDVTTIRHAPPNRQEVHTYLVEDDQASNWWKFLRDKLNQGRQAFVVAPLVGESEQVEAESAEQLFEELTNGELADYRVGLVHGRMTATEKDAAMHEFRHGRTQVLVSTSVVEVGVDVPSATVMTIQGAERFGLAQLHQLRGRIARGSHIGYCGVFANCQTEDARQRLQSFVATSDGFELAEIDFARRGPGDLLGVKQSGLPPLRIADLRRDEQLLQEARAEAKQLIAEDPQLEHADHALLRHQVMHRYGEALELGDVG